MRNLKKLLALVLTLALAFSLAIPSFAAPIADFPDGADATSVLDQYSDSYTYATQMLIDLGVIAGGDGGNLNLGKTLSRAEFVVLLYQAMHEGQRIATAEPNWTVRYAAGKFADTAGHWAEGEIAWAAQNGYVSGNGYGFSPYTEVTFNNGIMLIMNALGYDPVREGLQTLADKTWIGGYTTALGVYLRDAYLDGVMGDLVALDADGKLNRAEAFYLFWQFLSSDTYEYMFTLGSLAQSRAPSGKNWLEASFSLVSGEFMVINDGKYFGLPTIANTVSVSGTTSSGTYNHVNNGGLKGNDADGRAVIQRPVEWDRLNGGVTVWDTYILSEADTKAIGINVDSVGQVLNITFSHPDLRIYNQSGASYWDSDPTDENPYDNDTSWRPGDYHSENIEKVYGDPYFITTLDRPEDFTSDIVMAGAGNFFINYAKVPNDSYASLMALPANYFSGSSKADAEIRSKFRNEGGWEFRLNGNSFKNADIRIVKSGSRTLFTFVEYYVVSKIDNFGDNLYLTGNSYTDPRNISNKIEFYNGQANPGHNVGKWQFAERVGDGFTNPYATPWANGEYVAISDIKRNAEWGGNNQIYFLKRVDAPISGVVTTVSGAADIYQPNGEMYANGTGSGTMILNSADTYGMSASASSRIRNFNTSMIRSTVEVILWHGQVVEVITDSIPRPYALITAAGVSTASNWNAAGSVTYYADLLLADGTRLNSQIIDKVVRSDNNTAATNVMNRMLAYGQYGPNTTSPITGNEVYYWGSSAIFDGGPVNIENHIFRVVAQDGHVTHYESAAAKDSVTAPATDNAGNKIVNS
ncbi:MAG: S-layer homology domain-containing protein, partial [Oscillospiraceae bacterium]|nr:S-layer homology domain-containing protein [Oscillospiraceae bacterium]